MTQAEQWGWYSDGGFWVESSDNRIIIFATLGEAVAFLRQLERRSGKPYGWRVARIDAITGEPMSETGGDA